MRTLLKAGVIELAREGRVRGAVEHFYALVPDNAAELADPLVALQKLCAVLTLPNDATGLPQPVTLDEQARTELQTLLDRVEPKVRRIVRQAARRADSDTTPST